jgi:hypothetical protein
MSIARTKTLMNYLGYLTLSYVLYLQSRPSSKAFDGPLSYRCHVISELDGLSSNPSKLEVGEAARKTWHTFKRHSLALARSSALTPVVPPIQHLSAPSSMLQRPNAPCQPSAHSNAQGPSQDGRDHWETPGPQKLKAFHTRCIYNGTAIFHTLPFQERVFLCLDAFSLPTAPSSASFSFKHAMSTIQHNPHVLTRHNAPCQYTFLS